MLHVSISDLFVTSYYNLSAIFKLMYDFYCK